MNWKYLIIIHRHKGLCVDRLIILQLTKLSWTNSWPSPTLASYTTTFFKLALASLITDFLNFTTNLADRNMVFTNFYPISIAFDCVLLPHFISAANSLDNIDRPQSWLSPCQSKFLYWSPVTVLPLTPDLFLGRYGWQRANATLVSHLNDQALYSISAGVHFLVVDHMRIFHLGTPISSLFAFFINLTLRLPLLQLICPVCFHISKIFDRSIKASRFSPQTPRFIHRTH